VERGQNRVYVAPVVKAIYESADPLDDRVEGSLHAHDLHSPIQPTKHITNKLDLYLI